MTVFHTIQIGQTYQLVLMEVSFKSNFNQRKIFLDKINLKTGNSHQIMKVNGVVRDGKMVITMHRIKCKIILAYILLCHFRIDQMIQLGQILQIIANSNNNSNQEKEKISQTIAKT